MDVTDPAGRTWRVERRLIQLPRWRGLGNATGASDGFGAPVGDDLTGLLVGVALVIAVAVATIVVWPLLVLLGELILAGLLLVGRFLLGRWTVVAQTRDERRSWRVRGRRESERFAARVVESLRTGTALPHEDTFESTPVFPPAPEETGHVRVIRSSDESA